MKNNEFEKILMVLHREHPLDVEQRQALQKIIDSDVQREKSQDIISIIQGITQKPMRG